GLTVLFAIASLGLPGLGNFIGEFLVLLGTFAVREPVAIVAAAGLVTSVIYALALIARPLHGEPHERRALRDLVVRETAALGALAAAIVWLGFYPQPLIDTATAAITNLQRSATVHLTAAERLR
ncbi:MAG: NADH-quinone oxidoreductase subunit M, partial [Steroidobacteraceae bacterium]